MNECKHCEKEFEPTNANQRFCSKKCQQAAHHVANKEKACARTKAHYRANKEKANARSKAHYEANREKCVAQKKVRYELNKEAISAQKKIYNEVNKERISAQKKVYRATPNGRAVIMWNEIRARVGKKSYEGIELRTTREEWMEWAIPQIEAFIEEHPDQTPSVDRRDPDGHYEISNLRIISWRANDFRSRYLIRKMKLTPETPTKEVHETLALSAASICNHTDNPFYDYIDFLIEIKKAHPEG